MDASFFFGCVASTNCVCRVSLVVEVHAQARGQNDFFHADRVSYV